MNSSKSSSSFLTRSKQKVRVPTNTDMTNSSMKTLAAVDISVRTGRPLLSGYVKTHIPTGILAVMQNQNHVHFLIASALSGTGNP